MKRYLVLALLLTACGQSPQTSETKWAHASAESSVGTIPALLSYLDLGFQTNFQTVSVCIQRYEGFSGDALLLETKLAYAAWLEASGQMQDANWSRFRFEMRDLCNPASNEFQSVVLLESLSKAAVDHDPRQDFAKPAVTCQKEASSIRCGSSATLGWGGPSQISYSYRNPAKWLSVSLQRPASVRLSPYVQWRSLETDMLEQESLSEAERKNLLELYRSLLAQADRVSSADLLLLNQEIQKAKLVAVKDNTFQKLLQDFQKSRANELNQAYTPQTTAFHVLLHEVGHQFGMDHADNPSLDAETGFVLESRQVGSQWVTSEAVMAYGEPFLFLTADDMAGVKSISEKNRNFLSSRR